MLQGRAAWFASDRRRSKRGQRQHRPGLLSLMVLLAGPFAW
jgi:hypothetical protein